MGLKKGTTNNPNGRPTGKPNRITGDLRAKIQSILNDNIDRVQDDLNSLDAKDRLQVLEKLLSYVLPKLQAQSIDIDFSNMSEENIDAIINQLNINQNE